MAGRAARVGLGEKVEPEPISVLLAEHEPEVAEMSARYLRRDGLRVRLVTTPEQALAELTGGPDAAAVLDLTMPGLDPRRIRRALRTPVIFLVAGPQGSPAARPGPQRRDDRPAAVAGPAFRPPPAGRHGPRRAGRAGAVAGPGRGTGRTGRRRRALARRPDFAGPDRGAAASR